jgi:hypothetical protein
MPRTEAEVRMLRIAAGVRNLSVCAAKKRKTPISRIQIRLSSTPGRYLRHIADRPPFDGLQ